MRPRRVLLLLRGLWLALLVWPYAVASGVPRPLALAAVPLVLAILAGDGALLYAARIVAALAIGAAASVPAMSPQTAQRILQGGDLRLIAAFVTAVLLWCTALLGWQVFRDATSRSRVLWLWLMGTLVLGLNHRFWGVSADLPTLAFLAIGLFLLAVGEDGRHRLAIGLAALLPLLGALLGLAALPSTPTALQAQSGSHALNLAGLRVAVTPAGLPHRISVNQPVSLQSTPLLSITGVPRDAYWQEAIYNRFSGSSWIAPSAVRTTLPSTPPLLAPSVRGVPFSDWRVRVTEFVPGSIGPIIYAGTPRSIIAAGDIGYTVAAARAIYVPGVSSYVLDLSVPDISGSTMAAARYLQQELAPAADLAVPSRLRTELGPLAARLKAGTSTPAELAARIVAYLGSHETYDPNFSPSRSGDPIGRFLLRTHRGYCDQFSTAFIILARLDGLPARWVVGFAPGPYSAQGRSELLLARNAHSWAEIDVAPYGWLPIDATPGAAPVSTPKPEPPAASAPSNQQGDLAAALLILAASVLGLFAFRRPAGTARRIRLLERRFERLCKVQGRMPPTLRERLQAQPPALQEELLPVLHTLEQARYAAQGPSAAELSAADRALRAAWRHRPRRH